MVSVENMTTPVLKLIAEQLAHNNSSRSIKINNRKTNSKSSSYSQNKNQVRKQNSFHEESQKSNFGSARHIMRSQTLDVDEAKDTNSMK